MCLFVFDYFSVSIYNSVNSAYYLGEVLKHETEMTTLKEDGMFYLKIQKRT